MALAKVEGILLNNDKIRREMLQRVYWKDKQYTDFGGDFVRDATIKTEEVSPIGEGKDLLNYTFDGKTDFSNDMLKKYMSNKVNHEIYEVAQIPDGERYRWEKDYFDYFEPYNLRYKVAEIKLAESEKRNDIATDARLLDKKYLTPDLLNFYGTKLNAQANLIKSSVYGLLDDFSKGGSGRFSDIAEADVNIIDDYLEAIDKPEDYIGSGFDYLREELEKAGKKRYVEYISYDTIIASDEEDRLNYFGNILGRGKIDNYAEFHHNTFSPTKVGATYRTYDEQDAMNDNTNSVHEIKSNNGEEYLSIAYKEKSLLSKTNKMFNEHKIATMIGRFHTTLSDDGVDNFPSTIDSTVRVGIGNSKGRNLLKKTAKSENGYDNPYCRVWTYHHQYDNVSKLIRPFRSDNGETLNVRSSNPYEAVYLNGIEKGSNYLENNTVLGKNGFVNIAPKKDGCGNASAVEIKKCMFSIENLAWKDVPRKGGVGPEGYYIQDEQRGPNGGRIMWFPPYDLNFQESVNVNWNQHNFIGRGEPVFTYSNTNRNGVLSFAILVDHPSIIDNIGANNLKEEVLSDDDILRYFAGCDIPEGFSQRVACDIDEANPENNKKPNDEPEEDINKKKGKRIKFNIYFPNNYSGNSVKTTQTDWSTNGSSDALWYDYLLFGQNVSLPKTYIGNGYETNSNGITFSVNPEDAFEVKQVTKPWQDGSGTTKDRYYCYRVDFDFKQNLKNKTKDGQDRGMVDTGSEENVSNYVDRRPLTRKGLNVNLEEQNDETATDAFSHILYVLMTVKPNEFEQMAKEWIVNRLPYQYNKSERYKELVEVFSHPERIKSVQFGGLATEQDNKNSELLAKRRCKSIEGLIMKFLNKDVKKLPDDIKTGENLVDKTAINTLEARKQRMAYCELIYDIPEISNVADTGTQPQKDVNKEEGEPKTLVITDAIPEMRYENEAEYFKNIDKNDPLIHKKLIEKFKYFNPAFHSISPEGFNARLTFLQQCTRQGHTIEATSGDFAKTAGNLSFGRMPVCVLRLGDFLNTRMIINGVSINYDTGGAMQWDLNPEGIGVQPMYAKVSLQVTLLGGQSLEGPINRLQNAITFNYYANTGVYDNRSDRIGLSNDVVSSNEEVRLEPVETAGDRYKSVTDKSEYVNTITSYKHIFTPYPKVEKEKVENKNTEKKAKK